MTSSSQTVWGIHAGATGDADKLFLQENFIAIGWTAMGDLGILPANREAFKTKAAHIYTDKKPGAIPVTAGQLFRFVHEMQPSDIIVYPSQGDRQIHIGTVSGGYKYDPGVDPSYPNLRPVNWLATRPRTDFTQGALYEVGSAMSLFKIKNYSSEYLAAIHGKTAAPPVENDETVTHVAIDIEENTRDYILKRLSQELKGHPFAEFTAHLLGTMGYRSRVSPPGPDGGIDIIAHRDELGFEPPIIKVQVKSASGVIGAPEVQALYGLVSDREFGLLVTLGTFTSQAKAFAASKTNLRLVSGIDLVDLALRHYEDFDARYKGLLPLKRVYVPEALDDLSTA